MPEKTDAVFNGTANEQQGVNVSEINLEELAEHIVRLLKKELELENQRFGNIYKGR